LFAPKIGRLVGQPEATTMPHANRVIVRSLDPDLGASGNILFLYSDTGGGHRAAAQAIDAALKASGKADQIETHHVDAFASCGVFPLREGVASYGTMLKVQPSPYPAIYHLTNGSTRFRVISEIGLPFIRRNFRRMLDETRPDIVVSVHPLLNSFARRLIEAGGLDAALVTVITDLVTIHHSWTAGAAADEYIVASPEAKGLCIARGIAPERIFDLGLPIRSGFHPLTTDPAAAKRSLGLDPSRRVVLVMGGGEGGGKLKKILSEIAPVVRRLNLQLVAIAGRNEALRKRLVDMADTLGDAPKILGFVDNVADYMRAADVLLTKAGPGAIAEAAACGLPVVLYEYISGQEKGNLDFVESRGAGIVALEPGSAAAALERLFSPGSTELARMRVAALRSARPHAARDIAVHLMRILAARRLVSGFAPPAGR
jgi:1,2-diacylglycerol 3-beta-galactosyltransferase